MGLNGWPKRGSANSTHKLTEIVSAVRHALHITKPLLFELVLSIWAVVETGRFIFTVALGHGG